MYKNLQFGNSNPNYNVKALKTSLDRIKGASLIFYVVPGPKMLWQFGELGYDFSINTCADGMVKADCRISPKPVKWDYLNDAARKNVYDVTADLIRLRNKYEVFTKGEATVTAGNALVKQVILKNKPYKPAPASSAEMNVVAITNFDIVSQSSVVELISSYRILV